jgi:hypothetical protein
MTTETQIANLERTIKGLRTAQTEIVGARDENTSPYYVSGGTEYSWDSPRLDSISKRLTEVIERMESRLAELERWQREENAKGERIATFTECIEYSGRWCIAPSGIGMRGRGTLCGRHFELPRAVEIHEPTCPECIAKLPTSKGAALNAAMD